MELFGEFIVDPESNIYKFTVVRVVNWKSYDGILRTLGDHVKGKSNKHVEAIVFSNVALDGFPRLLGCFFPNLKVVTVISCGLRSITRNDLRGLTNVIRLTLNGNKISSLPSNLFESTPNIETLSLYGNRIRFIGDKIFHKLLSLRYANLKMNLTIDVCMREGYNGVSLQHLKTLINSNCQPIKQDINEWSFEKQSAFERFANERKH